MGLEKVMRSETGFLVWERPTLKTVDMDFWPREGWKRAPRRAI